MADPCHLSVFQEKIGICHLRATRQNHDNKPEAVLYMNNHLTRCGSLGTEALSRPIGGTQEHTIPLNRHEL